MNLQTLLKSSANPLNVAVRVVSHVRHLTRVTRHALDQRKHKARRSSQWPAVERHFLSENSVCVACGGTERLNVHHIRPFHLYPELELDSTNLITLCMQRDRHCHLLLGHGGLFRAFVTKVRALAARLREYPAEKPRLVAKAQNLRSLTRIDAVKHLTQGTQS